MQRMADNGAPFVATWVALVAMQCMADNGAPVCGHVGGSSFHSTSVRAASFHGIRVSQPRGWLSCTVAHCSWSMCRAGPGDLGGPGVEFLPKANENLPQKFSIRLPSRTQEGTSKAVGPVNLRPDPCTQDGLGENLTSRSLPRGVANHVRGLVRPA